MQRWIIRIGFALMALLAISYFAVALISIFNDRGGMPQLYDVAGRPAAFSPFAALTLLMPVACIGVYWAWRKWAERPSNDVEPNPKLKRTRRERRAS